MSLMLGRMALGQGYISPGQHLSQAFQTALHQLTLKAKQN